jgi:hypothetical protein
MISRLIVFTKDGKKVTHSLAVHNPEGPNPELKIVFETSTEHFGEWLFFFMRDLGGYIETTNPEVICAALNIPCEEAGIVKVDE